MASGYVSVMARNNIHNSLCPSCCRNEERPVRWGHRGVNSELAVPGESAPSLVASDTQQQAEEWGSCPGNRGRFRWALMNVAGTEKLEWAR